MGRFRTSSITLALGLALVLVPASASAHERCEQHPSDCLGHWPTWVLRLHGGLGVFTDGGAVSTTVAVPDLFEHARLSAQLAGEVGIRPFGGGTMLSLILAGQIADGAVVGTVGLSVEYDLVYLFGDHDPDRDFAFALGGALALDFARTTTNGAAGIPWVYELLRPDWRLYLELRIRSDRTGRWLVRAQMVTGFDDFLDIASLTLCGGYAFEIP